MNIIIETSRLLLRELVVSDADAFFALNADPEVLRYTGDEAFESVEAARLFLENYGEYAARGFGRWAVIRKEDGRFVGWCGLKLNEEGQVDIGFRFFRDEWGKGYATEAAEACVAYGFGQLALGEIVGRAAAENVASIRVLEKLKMQFWKRGICQGIEGSLYYRIRKDEWES